MDLSNLTYTQGAFLSTCGDVVKKCYNQCYESRLYLTQQLGTRVNIALTVFIILVLLRVVILRNTKYEVVKRILDISLLIMGIFLLCAIYIY